MTVHRLIEGGAFDADTAALMGRAYEAAVRRLGSVPPDTVLETLAKRIVEAARAGERDFETLTAFALRGLDGTRAR
jgi:hypothetical protein